MGEGQNRRIVRRWLEMLCDWICWTVIRKIRDELRLFFLPGGEGQVEAGAKTNFIRLHPSLRYHPITAKDCYAISCPSGA